MSLFTFLVVATLIFLVVALLICNAQLADERDEAVAARHRIESMNTHPSNRNRR